MRAQALHADVLLVTSARAGAQLRGRARRAGGAAPGEAEAFVIDSPVLPEELDSLPGLLAAGGLPGRRAGCSRPTATGTTCSGGWRSRGSRSGCAESTARAPGGAARARPSASCGPSTKSSRSSGPRPLALGSLQGLPVPGRLRHRRPGARAAPDRRAHRRRDGDADRRGRGCWWPATTCRAIEIPTIHGGRRPRRLPRDARAAAGRCVERAEHVVPGHGPPMRSASGRCRCWSEDVAYLRAAARARRARPSCRRAAAGPASARCTRRTWRASWRARRAG